MIFKFLRRHFKDTEFEQTKIELVETRQVLKEYKEFLVQIQNVKTNDDSEKVEPDFLTLMWASIGVGIAIFLEAGKQAAELEGKMNEFPVYIWIILAVFSLYFIIANGINAIKLTRKYVKSKRDPIYRNYEWYLITGVFLLAMAVLAFAFLPRSKEKPQPPCPPNTEMCCIQPCTTTHLYAYGNFRLDSDNNSNISENYNYQEYRSSALSIV